MRHMEGTFSSALSIFQQLYMNLIPLGEDPNKTQSVLWQTVQTDGQVYWACVSIGSDNIHYWLRTANHQRSREYHRRRRPNKGSFWHLIQSTWRKVQHLGLVTSHRSEEVRLFCGMLDGLVLLLIFDVAEGLQYLKWHTSENFDPLVDYFSSNYVSGSYRLIHHLVGQDCMISFLTMCRTVPLFPPELWNVHGVTTLYNNMCEGWNNGFQRLVDCSQFTIWRTINNLQKDDN